MTPEGKINSLTEEVELGRSRDHAPSAGSALEKEAAVARGVAFLDDLEPGERRAFLGLFAGARFPWTSFNGGAPFIGKAECEWVDDWRDFYGRRLPDAGLFEFSEGEPKPALGMAPGSTFVKIECGPTALGCDVREAWWQRLNARAEARAAAKEPEPPALTAPDGE